MTQISRKWGNCRSARPIRHAGRRWLPCRAGIRKTRNGESFGKYGQTGTQSRGKLRSPSDKEKQKDYVMRKLTPTLTQSGLLAVLLQRQRDKISQLALRRAQRGHMRAALWSTLTWPWRALTAPAPVRPFAPRTSSDTSRADLKSFTEADCHISSNSHVHRTPATDSRRSADPTSRMGQAKWRIPQV